MSMKTDCQLLTDIRMEIDRKTRDMMDAVRLCLLAEVYGLEYFFYKPLPWYKRVLLRPFWRDLLEYFHRRRSLFEEEELEKIWKRRFPNKKFPFDYP